MTEPKPFAQRAQELLAREAAQAAKEQAAQREENRQAQLLAKEGAEKAKMFTDYIIEQVRTQIKGFEQLFTVPASPQTDAPLEILVRNRWLLTAKQYGAKLAIAIYDLEQLGKVRVLGRDHILKQVTYEIALNKNDEFYWKHSSSSSASSKSVKIFGQHEPHEFSKGDEVAEYILNQALALAEGVL